MILGRIIGKTNTRRFEFLVSHSTKKFEYCQVYHRDYGYVLCQVLELEKTTDKIIAKCQIIGYKDDKGIIRQIRNPFDIDTEVLKAENDFIKSIVVGDESIKNGAFIGKLEGTDIDIYLDLNKLLTKHIAVLAKSGSGKSYSVGVLLEEIMERNVPLLVIDPHGEYSSMKKANDKEEDIKKLKSMKLKPKAYNKKIVEYGDPAIDPNLKPIRLNDNLSAQELIDLLPTKLTNNQLGLLYSTVKDMENFSFDSLIMNLQASDNNLKWNLINTIEYVQSLKLFSSDPTSYNELIQPGRASIINLRGAEPEVQQILVYKLLKDLFAERKKGTIPPFFLVVEEAHNFVPEKGYSEAKSSKIIKTIASEGRKFGLGLCVVSQRPAIVQKSVISQCTTQIILKVTNPNDLKAISSSVEGITSEAEAEIRNLVIGNALITGIVDMPLFVNVRPRKTKHGGEAVDILNMQEDESRFFDDLDEFKNQKLMPLIIPNLTKEDVKTMTGKKKIRTQLIPCMMFACRNRTVEYNLLIEMVDGGIIPDIEDPNLKSFLLPDIETLSRTELKLLESAFALKKFTPIDIIKKAGLSFDAKNDLAMLLQKGYIINKDGFFMISDSYLFSNPAKHAFYGKIDFKNIKYDIKADKKQRIDVIKAKLSKFTNVLDQRECFLVHYLI